MSIICFLNLSEMSILVIRINYNDLTVLPKPGIMVRSGGNYPKIAQHFRLVKYCNLPRLLMAYWYMANHGWSNIL